MYHLEQKLSLTPFVKIYLALLAGIVLGFNLTLFLSQIMLIPLGLALMLFFTKHSLKKFATYLALFTLGASMPYLQYKEPLEINMDREEVMIVKGITTNKQIFICNSKNLPSDFLVIWDNKKTEIAIGDTLIATVQFDLTENAHYTLKNLDKSIDLSAKVIGKSWNGSKYINNRKEIIKCSDTSALREAISPFHKRIRDWGKSRLSQLNIESKDIEVINGMLLGDRSNISKDRKELFRESGISHLLAISGMHIGIIFVILNLIFVWRRNSYVTRIFGSVAIIALIWIFTLIVGSPISAVRASFMFTILQISIVRVFSPYQIYNTLFATATLITLYNYRAVADIGFQLSFVALLSILLFLPFFERATEKRNKFIKFTALYVGITIASQILTLPLTLYYFGYLPIVLIPANIIGILAIYFILTFSIIYIIYPNFIVESVIYFTFEVLNASLQFLLSLPCSVIENISFSTIDVILYYFLIYSIYCCYITNFKIRTIE